MLNRDKRYALSSGGGLPTLLLPVHAPPPENLPSPLLDVKLL